MLDNLSVGKNPPEEITVNAKFNPSKSRKSTKLYKKIIKIVEKK